METKYLISVITVVFNGKKDMEQTIQSVLRCKTSLVEYIIVDGGSSDGTVDIIRNYSDQIDRWISEPDKGIYDAMNKGIDLATGKWIYFLNCGDFFVEPDTLSKLIKKANSISENEFLCGRVQIAKDHAPKIEYYPKFTVKDSNLRKLFDSCFCHQALLISKKAYDETGRFDLEFRFFSDFNSVRKLLSRGYSIRHVDLTISSYNLDGVSSNWRYAKLLFKEKEQIFNLGGVGSGVAELLLKKAKLAIFITRKKIISALS